MQFISPLRYPGGKGKLGPYFARVLSNQPIPIGVYAEPYAGGAGAGLYLLTHGYIEQLLINDLNPGIAAFWRSILFQTEEFIARLNSERVCIDAWHIHRNTYLNPDDQNDLDLGFATFFLNRCNRSGILTARPIGGLDQSGRWKIDARYNRDGLSERIRYVAAFRSQILITQKPALEFVGNISRRANPVLMYVDPPYLVQGEELYMTEHSWQDHEKLAKALVKSRHPWILTYDADERVRDLYPSNRCLDYSIKHTAQTQKVGREFMLFSRGLRVPDFTIVSKRSASWLSSGTQSAKETSR